MCDTTLQEHADRGEKLRGIFTLWTGQRETVTLIEMALAGLLVAILGVLLGGVALILEQRLQKRLLAAALAPQLRPALEALRTVLAEVIAEEGDDQGGLNQRLAPLQRLKESVEAIKDDALKRCVFSVLKSCARAQATAPAVLYLSAYETEDIRTAQNAALAAVVSCCREADAEAEAALRRLTELEARAPR